MKRICLLGDVMVGRSFNELFDKSPHANVWGTVGSHITKADASIANLETTITSSNTPWPGQAFNFKLDPKYASACLSPIRLSHANLANNHMGDFGKQGLIETMQVLDKLGIRHAGAGLSLKQAQEAVTVPIRNITTELQLVVLGAADHYLHYAAGEEGKAGIFYIDTQREDWSTLLARVVAVKRQYGNNAMIVTCLHVGPNWETAVPPWKKKLAHDLAKAGCDIIHMTSAHHVEPCELIGGNDSLVFYSMGDTLDDYAIDEHFRNDLGFIADVLIDGSAAHRISEVRILPTKIQNMTVDFARSERDSSFVLSRVIP